jgi:hypothetical protein
MSKSLTIGFAALYITCFQDGESRNLKDVVLISPRLARRAHLLAPRTRRSAAFPLLTGLRCRSYYTIIIHVALSENFTGRSYGFNQLRG